MKTLTKRGPASAATSLALLLFSGCAGEAGVPGPAGPPGEDGEDGSDGEPGAYVAGVESCTAVDANFQYAYDLVVFSTGDVFVSCYIADEYAGSSATRFYLASQVGAETGGCFVHLDVAGAATAGFWGFEGGMLEGATATYHDPGDPADGFAFTFQPGDCVWAED